MHCYYWESWVMLVSVLMVCLLYYHSVLRLLDTDTILNTSLCWRHYWNWWVICNVTHATGTNVMVSSCELQYSCCVYRIAMFWTLNTVPNFLRLPPQLPVFAKSLGKRVFKKHYESFLDSIFYGLVRNVIAKCKPISLYLLLILPPQTSDKA